MEALANKIAIYLGKNLNKDDEQIAVMAYGLVALLQTCSIFIVSLAFGIIFNFLPETMISFFSVGILRRLIGGHHSSKLYSCLTVSIICILSFSAITRYLFVPLVPIKFTACFVIIVYILAFLLTYKLAPVDNPNKRIRTDAKRKRLRKNSFLVLLVFFLISLVFILFRNIDTNIFSRISVSLSISVLWQVFMLTSAGESLIGGIDALFVRHQCSDK